MVTSNKLTRFVYRYQVISSAHLFYYLLWLWETSSYIIIVWFCRTKSTRKYIRLNTSLSVQIGVRKYHYYDYRYHERWAYKQQILVNGRKQKNRNLFVRVCIPLEIMLITKIEKTIFLFSFRNKRYLITKEHRSPHIMFLRVTLWVKGYMK